MRGYLQYAIIGESAYFMCERRGEVAWGSLGGVTLILGRGRRGLLIFCEYFKLWRKRGDRLLPPLLATFGLNMNSQTLETIIPRVFLKAKQWHSPIPDPAASNGKIISANLPEDDLK